MKQVLILCCFSFVLFACSSSEKPSEEAATSATEQSTPTLSNSGIKEILETQVVLQNGEVVDLPGLDDPDKSLFVLVRHAEKESTAEDSGLTADGQKRANFLKEAFSKVPPQKILHSKYKRTIDTALPVAEAFKVEQIQYDNFARLLGELKDLIISPRPKRVLVVGHSNDIPQMLEFLSGKPYPLIPETEYGNIYFVIVDQPSNSEVIELTY